MDKSNKKYILSYDLGTSSIRAVLYNDRAHKVGHYQKKFTQYFPKAGWVEHDPEEIWQVFLDVTRNLLNQLEISANEIISVGITNQRETTVLWNKKTGKTIYNAVVWQDKRTADICEELEKKGYKNIIHQKTGLIINSYFSATKIKWILDNVVKKGNYNINDLAFGTIDSWILWNLTGGKTHATDYSNASRTMLFNIQTLKWDEELLDIIDIPNSILPEVYPSSYDFGKTDKSIFEAEIPITSILGDQQAALFGQCCFDEGDAKVTYGTGCFLLCNTGEKIVHSENGLLTTIAWGLDNKVKYALEGSVFDCASIIDWLIDEMKFADNPQELDSLAASVYTRNGVNFLPAFSGMGAPHWCMELNAEICGITRGTNKAHITKAAIESIGLQVRDIIDVMRSEAGIDIKYTNTDGGVSNSDYLMQFQSDILQIPVRRKKNKEMTALGVAYMAGIHYGLWDLNHLKNIELSDDFLPIMKENKANKRYNDWLKFITSKIVK